MQTMLTRAKFKTHLVFRLCRKYAEAVKGVKDSEEDFSSLSGSADPQLVQRWATEEAEALRNRDLKEDSMDIFDIKIGKGWLFYNDIPWGGTYAKQVGRSEQSGTSTESAGRRTDFCPQEGVHQCAGPRSEN
jgi:hypothetical protein